MQIGNDKNLVDACGTTNTVNYYQLITDAIGRLVSLHTAAANEWLAAVERRVSTALQRKPKASVELAFSDC